MLHQVRIYLFTKAKPIVLTSQSDGTLADPSFDKPYIKNAGQCGDCYYVSWSSGGVEKFPLQHIYKILEISPSRTTHECCKKRHE